MRYKYCDIIEKLNRGDIFSIYFHIKNYSHYSNCLIKRKSDKTVFNGKSKNIDIIEVKLASDNFETISFFNCFQEEQKLFKMGKKGNFTLKQIWDEVEIDRIEFK